VHLYVDVELGDEHERHHVHVDEQLDEHVEHQHEHLLHRIDEHERHHVHIDEQLDEHVEHQHEHLLHRVDEHEHHHVDIDEHVQFNLDHLVLDDLDQHFDEHDAAGVRGRLPCVRRQLPRRGDVHRGHAAGAVRLRDDLDQHDVQYLDQRDHYHVDDHPGL